MSIKDKLQEDWKQALKAKDKLRVNTITMVKAAILLLEKTNGTKLDDNHVIEVLAKEVKQRREALLEFEKGNRQDLVLDTKTEIEILLSYLPQQLTDDEIYKIIKEAADEIGVSSMKDMGKVMAAVNPKVKGRADGRLVSDIVKKYLNK